MNRRAESPSAPSHARPADLSWPERSELLPLLPLVFIAWSDGVLQPEEIDRIRGRLLGETWVDGESRELLARWLDPDSPPSAHALEALRAQVAQLRVRGGDSLRALVARGLEIARAEGTTFPDWGKPEALAALRAVEEELGVVGSEAVKDTGLPAGGEPSSSGSTGLPRPALSAAAASVPVKALGEYLDAPHAALRREVKALLRDSAFRIPHEITVDEHRRRVREALALVASRGWGALGYPKAVGGEADPGAAIAVFETLGLGDASVLVKFGVQFGLFGGSIFQLGSERHHARYLPAVGRLDLPGCYAMTETGHGSNVRDVETVARYEPALESFILTTPHAGARKDFIGGGARDARMATVFAQLEANGERHGVHAFLVPIRDERGGPLPGIRTEDCGVKVGLNGVDNGRLYFDGVRVPRENLLDRFGSVDAQGRYSSAIASSGQRFFTMLGTLVAGRISVAAASVSASKTALTIAIRYASRRRQFGPAGGVEATLLSYVEMQRRLLPALAETYALHFAVRGLTADYAKAPHDSEAARVIEARAAALKPLASDACVRTVQTCREACGGQGYLAENRFGRIRADTDVFTTFEGANTVLLLLVAKALLSDYRDEMGDLRLRSVVRMLADRAETRLTEMNPVTTRRSDPEHLKDPEFQLAAFRYREERLVRSAAARLRALINDGTDTFDAMNVCQDHLVLVGRAHGERLAVEAIHKAVADAPAGTADPLRTLADLYALSRLEADRGWFLETGYFEPPKSRGIRSVVNELCAQAADLALPLVDAFGIPEEVLEAPAGAP